MKYIKYLRREFTLLEHSLIMESLTKENTCVPEIFILHFLDISRNGLMDICISEKDFENNEKRVSNCITENGDYIHERLQEGLIKVKELCDLPKDLLENFQSLKNEDIVKQLLILRQKLFDFGGFVDFTHALGRINTNLTSSEIKNLGQLHDMRKISYLKYFDFWSKISKLIAQKFNIEFGSVSYLLFDEIIKLLNGKLSLDKADKLQRSRVPKYILSFDFGKATIFCGKDFEMKLKALKFVEYSDKEIKGVGINKGVVKGEVKVVNPKMSLKEIPNGKIIVIPMTHPNITPVLIKSKAIITDEGGILCHAANLAREFGIVTVINTKIATKTLHDGDLVEVDANKGTVKIIEKAK